MEHFQKDRSLDTASWEFPCQLRKGGHYAVASLGVRG